MSKSRILVNQVECLKCGDKPFSAHRHDYSECSCGTIAVDGGMDYLKRSGDLDQYKDISVIISEEAFDAIGESLEWAEDTGRNTLGKICAIGRYLRDAGYVVKKKEKK